MKTAYATVAVATAILGASIMVGERGASAGEVCTPVSPPAATVVTGAQTIFAESFDHGFSQWTSVQTHSYDGSASNYKGGYSLKVVNDGPGHETALRTEVRDGDTAKGSHERAELSSYGKPWAANAGQDRWYEFDVKLGDSKTPWKTPKAWTIIAQWHAKNADGAPPVALSVHSDNKVYFEMEADDKPRDPIPVWDVRPGQWEHLAIHIGWDSSPSKGFIETFVNGQKAVARTPIQTMYKGDTQGTYLKIGTYRRSSNTDTSVVFHDNLRISG